MIEGLIGMVVLAVVGLVLATVALAVIGVVVGLVFGIVVMGIKLAVVAAVVYMVVKLVRGASRPRARLSMADQRWLDS